MQHDSQIRAAQNLETNTYDYSACFEYVKPIVELADLAIANLEVTLAGPPYKGYPQFSAPDELALGLKNSGFDVLVTANNHCVDRRRKGLERTIDVLDSLGISHTGTFKDSISRATTYPLIVASNEFKISLLNYTYGTNGIPVTSPNVANLIDTTQIKIDLQKARSQQTDATIVFMHWGDEYKDAPNKTQKELAEFCFNNGATLVVGSHPHVLQPMEWRKEKNQLVAYSLGNFVSGQQSRFRDGGAMLWVEFEKVTSDSLSSVRLTGASYELEWVYRNDEVPKKYFILPLKEFEFDTLTLTDEIAFSNLKLFAADSRKLLANNVAIEESQRVGTEANYYKILLASFSDSVNRVDTSSLLSFYGVHLEQTNDTLVHLITGKFYDRDIAEQALAEITTATQYKQAQIIWYYRDRSRDELFSGK